MQVWLHSFARPGATAHLATAAEAAGYDGMLLADSQNLTADIWVELALAGAATERLGLGPGVTNPATRHPAVTASAAATLAAEIGDRVVVDFARGDSALSQVGLEPGPPADFEHSLRALQGYLAGEEVSVGGYGGRIAWLPREGEPKVPVRVAATGPRVIAAGARHAEGVDFTVGAETERLRWAVGVARGAAEEAGRHVSLGACVDVAVADDRALARDLVRGSTSTLARFGAEGAPADGLSDVTREGIRALAAAYQEARHGQAAGAAAQALSDDFLDRFAVCGPAEEVAERLLGIAALGIERLIVVPGSLDADPDAQGAADRAFEREVLPRLRASGG
jgi:5,10-methylenetetrahydromethanopterin reductase